jgi:hypothetical protein
MANIRGPSSMSCRLESTEQTGNAGVLTRMLLVTSRSFLVVVFNRFNILPFIQSFKAEKSFFY